MNSREAKEKMSKEEFNSFRSKRRNVLLSRRGLIEREFENRLCEAFSYLSGDYKFKVIAQHSKFIPDWGLAYADFLVRAKSNKTNYGKKFWIEVDEPHHFTKKQYVKDRIREEAIVKKLNISILRFRKDSDVREIARFLNWEK